MADYVTPGFGHNGGPPLDDVPGATSHISFGEAFMCLFQPADHKALFGGRGSGKSHACGTALPIISAKETKRIVCARQFQNSIKDSVKELIEIKINLLGLKEQFSIYEREIVHKKTESRYTFIGLDRNPDSAKSLEGADICWVEEARTISARSMEILIPTIRKPGSEIWWTWNPELRTDPVDYYFRGPNPPKNAIIKQVGIEDNPWFYQGRMPNEMWHMQAGNFERYRHIWLGDYDESYDSKVFSNITIGTIQNLPEHAAPRYGMDFGFGSDPSVILKLYVLEEHKIIYIEKEVFGRVPLRDMPGMIDSVIDDRDDLIKADSSQPGTIDHLQSQGFNVIGAKKGPGSVKAGINWLQGYKIVIHPACEGMREEARLYSWQVDRISGKRLSVPVDMHNHGWDAARYATEDAQTEDGDDTDDGVFSLNFSNPRRNKNNSHRRF